MFVRICVDWAIQSGILSVVSRIGLRGVFDGCVANVSVQGDRPTIVPIVPGVGVL